MADESQSATLDSTAPSDPQSALISLMNQRFSDPMNLNLRDQEHAAFSQMLLHRLGPILGPAVVMSSVPAYSAAKGGAQSMGMMQNATPASFREVRAGLSPLWGGQIGPQKPPETPQPPQDRSQSVSNPIYTLLRLLGVIQ
jgi:hypothetical protein